MYVLVSSFYQDETDVLVLNQNQFQYYEIMKEDSTKTSTEMKCYLPGAIQRNKKVRDIE